MQMVEEFKEFVKEYKVLGLAVGFIMGTAATNLVNAIVANVIMPIITPFIPGGGWQTAVWNIGPVALGWGPALAAIINFLIMAWVVFLVAKFVFKEEKVTKK